MIIVWMIVLNGIVEGLTEFIPVSSTGHLIVLDTWLQMPVEQIKTFQIAIQWGAIMAVCVYYRAFFRQLTGSLSHHGHT